MRCEASNIDVRSVSVAQMQPITSTQFEEVGDDTFLDSVATLSKINCMGVVQHGARLAAIGELLGSVLTHMSGFMRADIARSLRDRIDDLMSLGDDRSPSEQYPRLY